MTFLGAFCCKEITDNFDDAATKRKFPSGPFNPPPNLTVSYSTTRILQGQSFSGKPFPSPLVNEKSYQRVAGGKTTGFSEPFQIFERQKLDFDDHHC